MAWTVVFDQIRTIEVLFQGLALGAYGDEIMFVADSAREADKDDFVELLLWLLAKIIGHFNANEIAGEYFGVKDISSAPYNLRRIDDMFHKWKER